MLTPTKPVKSCECSSPCGDCCGCTKESIGLGNVDNTSDLNKPLSTAMINALSGKVDLDTFTQLKNRVLALENSMPDITDLEHRMDEAEDDILGLNAGYTALHNTVLSMADSITELGGRVTGVTDALVTVNTRVDALEVADGNNVKLTGNQDISGIKKFNNEIRRIGAATGSYDIIRGYTSDGVRLWEMCYSGRDDNSTKLYVNAKQTDGNLRTVILADGIDTNDGRLVMTRNHLDSYAPMVRTTGNQNIAGIKNFQDGIMLKKMNTSREAIPAGYHNQEITHINDANNVYLAQFVLTSNTSSQDPTKRTMYLQVRFYGKNGDTSPLITIAQGDVPGE